MDECYWDDDPLELTFNSKLGFTNMLQFFKPEQKEIKVIWGELEM